MRSKLQNSWLTLAELENAHQWLDIDFKLTHFVLWPFSSKQNSSYVVGCSDNSMCEENYDEQV